MQDVINRGRAAYVADATLHYDKIIEPYLAIIIKLSREVESLKGAKSGGKKK